MQDVMCDGSAGRRWPVLTPVPIPCRRQVDEAQSIMRQCEKLKDERDRLKRNNEGAGSVWHQVSV